MSKISVDHYYPEESTAEEAYASLQAKYCAVGGRLAFILGQKPTTNQVLLIPPKL